MLLFLYQFNNTALGQVIVLPSAGSPQYNSVIQKVMNCHVCLGKSSEFVHYIIIRFYCLLLWLKNINFLIALINFYPDLLTDKSKSSITCCKNGL